MIAVIADDITGAAEIAGIGYRYGLNIHLITRLEGQLPESDLLVYATDTRSMSCEEAVEETRRVVRELWAYGVRILFKKTDSALRGHITKELQVLLEETNYQKALLLPENPSRGRTIKEGIYYLYDKPIAETDFSFDPEFPAYTSSVIERFPEAGWVKDDLRSSSKEIIIADAQTISDIRNMLQQCSPHTILAGAADLFSAYLESIGYLPTERTLFAGLEMRNALIVCGSTQSVSLENTSYCLRKDINPCRMPVEVFKGIVTSDSWIDSLKEEYQHQGSMLLTIGYPSEGGKAFALRLRNTMSSIVGKLLDLKLPQEIIIEGGATAFAILDELDWHCFEITDEISPGIIRMKSNAGTHVILKPGSYQWGEILFQ